jgi:hypothetical protein
MTTTPGQASDGLPSAATPLRRGAAYDVNAVHQGVAEIVLSSDHPAPDVLDAYRQEAGLSHQELWLRYLERGGIGNGTDVEAIVCGVLVPSDHDHDVIALALNERFMELGRDHPVPYATE